MSTITREEFFKLYEVKFPTYEEIKVPGIEKPFWVKEMNCGERDKFEQELVKFNGQDNRARWVAACCINEQGALVFDSADIPTISTFPPAMIDPIVKAAIRVNRLSDEDKADLEKNLNGQGESSSVA